MKRPSAVLIVVATVYPGICTTRSLLPGDADRGKDVRPVSARSDSQVRAACEARSETPLHGRHCLRRQRNLRGAASVPAPLSKAPSRAATARRRASEPRARAAAKGTSSAGQAHLATCTGVWWRAVHQARPVLLAASGGEPPDAAAVRKHGAADRGVGRANRIGLGGGQANRSKQGGKTERCMRNRLE
jgi:hypothetical protein